MIPIPNTQPVEKSDERLDGSLDIVSVFRTIQGEGPFAGRPAVFVRLAGCNLNCPACDTDYTTKRLNNWTPFAVEDWIWKVNQVLLDEKRSRRFTNLVVITGGEPFRQNLGPLARLLLNQQLTVQVETNGTLYPTDFPFGNSKVIVVCSPKTPHVNENLVPYIGALKYVVEAGKTDPVDGLPTSVLGNGLRPFRPANVVVERSNIFVQPQDDQDPVKNEANLKEAVRVCMRYGYRLGYQLHKLVGLD